MRQEMFILSLVTVLTCVGCQASAGGGVAPDDTAVTADSPVADAPADSVYRTGAKLLGDMPKNAYPKAGEDAGIERAAANKWCRSHLVGRTIEWTATVKTVQIFGDDPFTVSLTYDEAQTILYRAEDSLAGIALGGPFSLDKQQCRVVFQLPRDIANCPAAQADSLRKLKGRRTVFRGTVTGAGVSAWGSECDVYKDFLVLDGSREYPCVTVRTPEQVLIVLSVTVNAAHPLPESQYFHLREELKKAGITISVEEEKRLTVDSPQPSLMRDVRAEEGTFSRVRIAVESNGPTSVYACAASLTFKTIERELESSGFRLMCNELQLLAGNREFVELRPDTCRKSSLTLPGGVEVRNCVVYDSATMARDAIGRWRLEFNGGVVKITPSQLAKETRDLPLKIPPATLAKLAGPDGYITTEYVSGVGDVIRLPEESGVLVGKPLSYTGTSWTYRARVP